MGRRTIFISLGLLLTAGALADAYKWTDAEGIVHYSDRPHPGATVVVLGSNSGTRPRPSSRPAATNNSDEATTPANFGYESIEIATPAAEETLWNIGGTLSVSLTLTPALRPGHQVRVYFDGTPQTVGSANFQLQEVYRGVHNLQAEVIDETGKLMIRSRPNRFYVQQNSVYNSR